MAKVIYQGINVPVIGVHLLTHSIASFALLTETKQLYLFMAGEKTSQHLVDLPLLNDLDDIVFYSY